MKEKELLNNDKTPLGFENKGIEIISKRGKREKHFLQKDGSFIAQMYSDDIHFKKNGKYEEIDNRLEKVSEYYKNKNNSFDVYFKERSKGELLRYELQEGYIGFELIDDNDVSLQIIDGNSKFTQTVKYENIFEGIDFEYLITSTKVKENIIIKEKEFIPEKISFILHTNFELKLTKDGNIAASIGDNTLFTLDVPYMIDSTQAVNNNIRYELIKINDMYNLKLVIDKKKIYDSNLSFPIIIDPTISTIDKADVFDVTLNEVEPNTNCNDYFYLGVDLDSWKKRRRTLIKFNLPKIGTGSQIINSDLKLIAYPGSYERDMKERCIDVHRVTSNWDEKTATWNNMSSNYDSFIETNEIVTPNKKPYSNGERLFYIYSFDITSLVKRWYTDTPNYGVLLKEHKEVYYDDYNISFYSKDNQLLGPGVMPVLQVNYLNQNGLESYMKYEKQILSHGIIYENLYNGNIVTQFNVGNIYSGVAPLSLNLIYNSNDVILEHNYGYGLGYKLDVQEIVKKVTISEHEYIEYLDSDGTLHYYYKEGNEYKDEEGLNSVITEDNKHYYLTDAEGNIREFAENGYLTEVTNINNSKIIIEYNDDNSVKKVKNGNDETIDFTYENGCVTIKTQNEAVILNYSNSQINSIIYDNGSINILYNSLKLIRNICDINMTGFQYEYYDVLPYRVKKVLEYGLKNAEGNSLILEYSNNLTTTIDNKNRISTINFNTRGNPITTSTWVEDNNINGAYSSITSYADDRWPDYYKNKIFSRELPVRFIKNHLKNIDFESNEIYFKTQSGVDMYLSDDCPYDGYKSLKVVNTVENSKISDSIIVPKGSYYTFSGYFKSINKLMISLSYISVDGNLIEEKETVINPSDQYNRHDVSIYYPDDANSYLTINIYMLTIGTFYLDNVQLEEGNAANLFNCVDNSDFSQGYTGWEISSANASQYQIVKVDKTNAINIKMDVSKDTYLRKTINVKGAKGDWVTVGFWYKNRGITSDEYRKYNTVTISFNYTEEVLGYGIEPVSLDNNKERWQYYTRTFSARGSFDKIYIEFWQENQANDLYITNISLIKNINNSYNYEYDNMTGKLLGFSEICESSNININDAQQLVSIITNSEDKAMFEYDNIIINRELSGRNKEGLVSSLKYDEYGNVTANKTWKSRRGNQISTGSYKLRMKGTHQYLTLVNHRCSIVEDEYACTKWQLEVVGEYIKISHPVLNNKFWCFSNNDLIIGDYGQYDNALFELIEAENGSFYIKAKNFNKYLKLNDKSFMFEEIIDEEFLYQLYFESAEPAVFFEENFIYTDDGKSIIQSNDRLLNTLKYNINNDTGLINYTVDPMNNFTYYSYDEKNNIVSIIRGDKEIQYDYDEYSNLKSIFQSNRRYNIIYDAFLNIESIKIGETTTLFTNDRESNNGNIKSITYGNGQKIEFSYDRFDRIIERKTFNDIFHYVYGANNELLKIVSNSQVDKFSYDLNKRLINYRNGDFYIQYSYDQNSNIKTRTYKTNNFESTICSNYGYDNDIINVIFDDKNISYDFDDLGRLKQQNINDVLKTSYEYINNGYRATKKVNFISNNGDCYSYKYDHNSNITHIIHNGELEIKYYYDKYNQLIQEDDILSNKTNRYIYDEYGNILFINSYKLKSYELLDRQKYSYGGMWTDQLSCFNGKEITYDEIGNPLTYDKIVYTWSNGRELSSYNDGVNIITYQYNDKGIRTKKIVNGIETNYYTEGNNIIFEEKGGSLLYFIRDNNGNLVGFKYDGEIYYYIKNLQKDIIGIMNSDSQVVAKYKYDSWGRILTVTDNDNNQITDNYHVAIINPFRYRSYYYDEETGLYYLNSRYYNPCWKRFINCDSIVINDPYSLGYNLYVYADNNPINRTDDNGNKSSWWDKITKKIKKNVGNIIKTVCTIATAVYSIYKVVKNPKIIFNQIKKQAHDDAKFIKDHFYFEIGGGKGFSGTISKPLKVQAGAYQDYTKIFSKGDWETQVVGAGSLGHNSNKNFSGDYSCEYNPADNPNNTFRGKINASCDDPNQTHTGEYKFVQLSGDGLFMGLDYEAHFFFGGHIKIGFMFNPSEYGF